MSKASERAASLAKGAGVAALVAAAAWGAYMANDPEAEQKQTSQAEKYFCSEWVDSEGESKHGCQKMKQVEFKAAVKAGLASKDCGTIKERGEKCPLIFPKAERCAKCADGTLCRYGKKGKEDCDPDDCDPHVCTVIFGEDPDAISKEVSE